MNPRRRFLLGVSLTAALAVLTMLLGGPRGTTRAAAQPVTDGPNTHNMVVLGEETVFLSHLPMFQQRGEPPMPHRYQVILEVTLAEHERYVKDRREHGATRMYTLNPEDFVLPDLVSTDAQRPPVRSFKAKTIFRGHLERDDRVSILQDVDVSVKRVTLFRRFDPKARKPARLEYLLFGKGQELFLAHVITAPPDFDQLLAVTVAGHAFTDDELAQGVAVGFPGTKNAVASRLKAKQRADGEVKLATERAPKKIQVEVTREVYLEEGELRVPPFMRSTTVEREAGFP